MRDDDELEMLLGEIPHATSSLSHNPIISDTHSHLPNNVVNHGFGNASFVTWEMDGHGVHSDELLRHKYACAASPVSGFSLQSDGSYTSLLSGGGGLSFSDVGSPSPPHDLVDDLNLSRNFSNLNISIEQDGSVFSNGVQSRTLSPNGSGVSIFPNGIQSRDPSPNGDMRMNFEKYCDRSRGLLNDGGFNNLSFPRVPMDFQVGVETQHDQRLTNLSGSSFSPGRHERLIYNPALNSQIYRTNMLDHNKFPMGFLASDLSPVLNRPSVSDTLFYASRTGLDQVQKLGNQMPHYDQENRLYYQPPATNGRNNLPLRVGMYQGCVGAFREDSLIIQGENISYAVNSGHASSAPNKVKNLHHWVNRDSKMFCPFYLPTKCNPLGAAQGYIYDMAKDQHGCRLLQRMFDEGTPQDVQIIFNEIIDHVAELMMNPFGNYLMQKLLEVCNEDQRTCILFRVTEKPGELVRISLNTHGTRVVQKLIETLKIRQQITLLISALEPGFLALIKDLNGNHVVQRCLQCFTAEDSKFIFIASTKYCVDIATHQHGCCVLQRCISRSTGELREDLVAEISANGLLLAQDAYGNYVVQFILDLKIPSVTSKLTSQFEGNYVHLSTQKFSSHVVEKCLVVCNDETRSMIINELLTATSFEQLLQDAHANYVIQTALRVSEGLLHNALVDAIESRKTISRNSPYSKKIFSHKLLKK